MAGTYWLWGGGLLVGSFLVSLLVVTLVIVKLPTRYFIHGEDRRLWIDQHPVVRFALHFLKNLFGGGLIGAGILLSLPGIPGQGLLTILIGILLLDFPGKLAWERRLVSYPPFFSAVNRIRQTFGRPPFDLGGDPP